MKPKANISIGAIIRLGVLFLLMYVPQALSAQEDSVRIIREREQINPIDSFLPSSPVGLSSEEFDLPPSQPADEIGKPRNISLERALYLPYYTNPSPLFKGDYSTDGVIKRFPHGVLFGAGGQTSIPGIGRFNDASIGYRHAFNEKWMLELGANAMKINMDHITGQAFSTSGTLFYRPSERVTFKVFGSYDIGNTYGMGSKHYGASIAFDMSERFGMEVGVQRYYDARSGRWETSPVVIPYYRFNKFTLGVDVGGIVHEILRNVVFDNKPRNNPTFGPPRFPIPIR